MTYQVTLSNLTQVSNSSTVLGFVQNANTYLMNGWLGIMILIMVSAITLIAFIQITNDPRKSFAAASVISFGFAILLQIIDIIPDLAVLITLVLAGFALATSRRGK